MRNLFILLILIVIAFSLKGQDTLNRAKLGLDFSMGNNALGRRNILPSITFTKKKHSVFLGPAFIYGMDYNPFPPAYGIQAGYLFCPNGTNKRFSLFFEYDFNYVKANFHFNYYYSYQTSTSIKTKDITVSSVDSYLGFGFRFNICEGLYFKTNVGLGIIYYGEKVSGTYTDGNSYSYPHRPMLHAGNFYPFPENPANYGYYYNSYYANKQFIGIVKAGLGFDIYSFKKKLN